MRPRRTNQCADVLRRVLGLGVLNNKKKKERKKLLTEVYMETNKLRIVISTLQ